MWRQRSVGTKYGDFLELVFDFLSIAKRAMRIVLGKLQKGFIILVNYILGFLCYIFAGYYIRVG